MRTCLAIIPMAVSALAWELAYWLDPPGVTRAMDEVLNARGWHRVTLASPDSPTSAVEGQVH